MPYRNRTEIPAGTGELVTFRSYLDPVEAQLARAQLTDQGIEARVVEAASYNPLLSSAMGGAQLQVRKGDLLRVEGLLMERPDEHPHDDGEDEGVIRCPRCELAYCFHERLRLEGNSAATALSFFAAPLMFLLPKRWHCHKCGHVWDDAKAGPAEMTRLELDAPRPVFRLRRRRPIAGLFLGLALGLLGMLVLAAALPREASPFSVLAFFLGGAAGLAMGRAWSYDLCSNPGCRAQLSAGMEECPRCRGDIAGIIDTAEEHYAAAAEFRRELAALRAKDEAPRKKQVKALPA